MRTGYCATEWNPKQREQANSNEAMSALRFAPREGAGAIGVALMSREFPELLVGKRLERGRTDQIHGANRRRAPAA